MWPVAIEISEKLVYINEETCWQCEIFIILSFLVLVFQDFYLAWDLSSKSWDREIAVKIVRLAMSGYADSSYNDSDFHNSMHEISVPKIFDHTVIDVQDEGLEAHI